MGDKTGNKTLLIGLGFAVVFTALMFLIGHYRGPSGWNEAWLDGQHLVVEEFREDDSSEDERIVVHDLATGKRLQTRDPSGGAHAFALVNGRLWLRGGYQPGLEAWSAKDLETSVASDALGLSYADTNVCDDGAFARVAQRDGRYALVDLAQAKVVEDRQLSCSSGGGRSGTASSSGQSTRGRVHTPSEGSSQRSTLTVGERPFGGQETFLEPQFLFVNGVAVDFEGDLFVIHRIELGDNRAMKLSRVGEAAVKWTKPLGDPSSIKSVLFAPPSTLVIVGHQGLWVIDVKSGDVLWRADQRRRILCCAATRPVIARPP